MACLDRQEAGNYVYQLRKANLLLKWPKSMLLILSVVCFFLSLHIKEINMVQLQK